MSCPYNVGLNDKKTHVCCKTDKNTFYVPISAKCDSEYPDCRCFYLNEIQKKLSSEEFETSDISHKSTEIIKRQYRDSFSPCDACWCSDCSDDKCVQAHCDKSDGGYGCMAPDEDCPPQKRKGEPMSYKSEDIYISPKGEEYRIHYDESQRMYHTEVKQDGNWKPNNSSWYPLFQNACGEFEAVCRIHSLMRQEGSRAISAEFAEIDDFNAKQIAMQEALSKIEEPEDDDICDADQEEITDTKSPESAESMDDSPADATDAALIRKPAAVVSLEAATGDFDYSGLDAQTVATLHSAETMIKNARKDYVLKIADAVAMAHDEFLDVAKCDTKIHGNRYSENTFRAWCESQGISKDAAYRLLQVSNLLDASTSNEQKILESAPASLLYAAAKPSAPPELVQQVKSGDIITNKQYQDALKEIQELRADRVNALNRAARAEKELSSVRREAELDRKEQEDANDAAQRFKAEADHRAQDQMRVEGLLKTRNEEIEQLRRENRELEKRPVSELLPPDPEEIARQAEQLAAERVATMSNEYTARIADLQHQLEAATVGGEQPGQNKEKGFLHGTEEAEVMDQCIKFGRLIELQWNALKPMYSRLEAPVRKSVEETLRNKFVKISLSLK